MINDEIIILLDEFADTQTFDSYKIIETRIDVCDRTVYFSAAVSDEHITVDQMVPFARGVADRLIACSVDHLARDNKCVSCQKGCSACCNYLVPLSVPEAIHMSKELAATEHDFTNEIVKSCVGASEKIINAHNSYIENSDGAIESLSDWYRQMNLQCPFLHDSICRIYDYRPIACREHMVTSASKDCGGVGGAGDKSKTLDLTVSVLEILGRLDAEVRSLANIDAVILPLAFGGEHNFSGAEVKWAGTEMVERFFELLEAGILQNTVSYAAAC